MNYWNKKVIREQLDNKIESLRVSGMPQQGWIRAIREALGLSARQLGKRAGLDQSRISRLENAEKNGNLKVSSLRKIAKGLSTVCLALEGLHHSLPVPPEEAAMLQGEIPMNVAMEVRTVIECVLEDHLRTTVGELQEAASDRPPGEERS